jgi:hypothetical protein
MVKNKLDEEFLKDFFDLKIGQWGSVASFYSCQAKNWTKIIKRKEKLYLHYLQKLKTRVMYRYRYQSCEAQVNTSGGQLDNKRVFNFWSYLLTPNAQLINITSPVSNFSQPYFGFSPSPHPQMFTAMRSLLRGLILWLKTLKIWILT